MLGVDLSWPAETADSQVRKEDTVALVAEAGAPAGGEVGREGLEGGQGGPGGALEGALGVEGASLAQARQEQQEQRSGGPSHH